MYQHVANWQYQCWSWNCEILRHCNIWHFQLRSGIFKKCLQISALMVPKMFDSNYTLNKQRTPKDHNLAMMIVSIMCHQANVLHLSWCKWKVHRFILQRWEDDESTWCMLPSTSWSIPHSSKHQGWNNWWLYSKLPNPCTWEISNSDKAKTLHTLDVCYIELDAFITKMHYCEDSTHDLQWVCTNKMKHPNWRISTIKSNTLWGRE